MGRAIEALDCIASLQLLDYPATGMLLGFIERQHLPFPYVTPLLGAIIKLRIVDPKLIVTCLEVTVQYLERRRPAPATV